tara:strand:+ start:2432 stop:2611 length:180 start_codon:yes stop_codon:yes gene_type:complete
MDTILITIMSVTFLIQVFFLFKLSQLMTEIDDLQEETEILQFQYFELQKLLKEQLMTTV